MPAEQDKANLLDIATRAFGDAADAIDAFVSDGMEKLGYRKRIEWDDPEPSEGQPPTGPRGGGLSFGGQRGATGSTGAPGQTRRVGGGEYGN